VNIDHFVVFDAAGVGALPAEDHRQPALEHGNILRAALLAVAPVPPHRSKIPFLDLEILRVPELACSDKGAHDPPRTRIAEAVSDLRRTEQQELLPFAALALLRQIANLSPPHELCCRV
jgi:hypothetical protein